jgi:hypothetical protein
MYSDLEGYAILHSINWFYARGFDRVFRATCTYFGNPIHQAVQVGILHIHASNRLGRQRLTVCNHGPPYANITAGQGRTLAACMEKSATPVEVITNLSSCASLASRTSLAHKPAKRTSAWGASTWGSYTLASSMIPAHERQHT